MSICIIGGGLTGCLIALHLADAGKKVVLFEKQFAPLLRASRANEGKIHLGFVYAADRTFRTARRMIDDALAFRPILERWMTPAAFDACLYDSFDYVVLKDSMLDVAAIDRHFATVADYLAASTASRRADYLGQPTCPAFTPARPTRPGALAEYHTAERGVWPARVAGHVARALRAHPAIELRCATPVARITPAGGKWQVDLATDPPETARFDVVVNAAWAMRRALDASAGFHDPAPWYYRYKFSVLLEDASTQVAGPLPRNATALLGAFGDSVYHPAEDTLYSSWYPVGMCHTAPELKTDDPPDLGDPRRAIQQTWRGCARFDPAYLDLLASADWRQARIVGDYIAAKAVSDIDDPASRLHERMDHGPAELAPGYWSVETGKYTSTARCADTCARRILGAA